jgi:hypothetical protein
MANVRKTKAEDDIKRTELLEIPAERRTRKDWLCLRAICERQSHDYKEPNREGPKLDELDDFDPEVLKEAKEKL